jgi:hypothetical protein
MSSGLTGFTPGARMARMTTSSVWENVSDDDILLDINPGDETEVRRRLRFDYPIVSESFRRGAWAARAAGRVNRRAEHRL